MPQCSIITFTKWCLADFWERYYVDRNLTIKSWIAHGYCKILPPCGYILCLIIFWDCYGFQCVDLTLFWTNGLLFLEQFDFNFWWMSVDSYLNFNWLLSAKCSCRICLCNWWLNSSSSLYFLCTACLRFQVNFLGLMYVSSSYRLCALRLRSLGGGSWSFPLADTVCGVYLKWFRLSLRDNCA